MKHDQTTVWSISTAWQCALARKFKGICLGAHRVEKPSPSGEIDEWIIGEEKVKSKYPNTLSICKVKLVSLHCETNSILHAKRHELRILVLKLQLQGICPCSSCAGNHWLLLPPVVEHIFQKGGSHYFVEYLSIAESKSWYPG